MNKPEEPKAKVKTFEEMLSQDGYLVYTNVGCSMLPLLRERRDIIEIRPKASPRCKKHDVVLYKRGDQYIIHRILCVLPDGYVIAGGPQHFSGAGHHGCADPGRNDQGDPGREEYHAGQFPV